MNDQRMVLMTAHGTLVCTDGTGTLYHVRLDAMGDGDVPLLIDLHAATRVGRHERMLTKTNVELTLKSVPGLPHECDLILAADRRTVTLRKGERFYCAEPMTQALASDRLSAGTWESFLPLTADDFATIRKLFNNRWVVGSTKKIVTPDAIRFREGFLLAFGDMTLDLRYNMPFLAHGQQPDRPGAEAFSYNVLVDGWKIERIHLYRPFIYLTAFGSPEILDRAFSAITSLIEFGRYDGQIHVITDRDEQTFLAAVPSLAPGQLSVQHLLPQDTMGYLASKLSILDYPPAYAFQPVFFMDSDVVCDAPLEPMLATVVTIGRISAPLEDTTFLRTNPSVGATLIQRAGLSPRWACGLNTGTIGLPNLPLCAEAIELMRTILTNHADRFGRESFEWGDQEVINYVSYQAAHFDTEMLLRFVRYGWEGVEFDGTQRLGLVHFWPGISNRPKQDRMRDYMTTLRSL